MGTYPAESVRPSTQVELFDLYELGVGGMGTVSLSRLRSVGGFERLVVVKRLHPHLARDPTARERFLGEARIASRIHHANVVGIQHVGEDARGYYLVLEYVDGGSLQELLRAAQDREARIPLRVASRILLDALAGLEAVHDARDVDGTPLGVLHRDISPHNLLVGRDGVTRVTDFGVSKTSSDRACTVPGTYVGKLRYVAPEHLMQEEIDRSVDIYGMGVTAWAILHGHAPWLGMSEGLLAMEIVREGLPPLDEDDAPLAVREVIAKACAMEPSQRYATAAELASAWEDAAHESGGVASAAEVQATLESMLRPSLEARREAASRPKLPVAFPSHDELLAIPPSRRSLASAPTRAEPRRTPSTLAPTVDVDLEPLFDDAEHRRVRARRLAMGLLSSIILLTVVAASHATAHAPPFVLARKQVVEAPVAVREPLPAPRDRAIETTRTILPTSTPSAPRRLPRIVAAPAASGGISAVNPYR